MTEWIKKLLPGLQITLLCFVTTSCGGSKTPVWEDINLDDYEAISFPLTTSNLSKIVAATDTTYWELRSAELGNYKEVTYVTVWTATEDSNLTRSSDYHCPVEWRTSKGRTVVEDTCNLLDGPVTITDGTILCTVSYRDVCLVPEEFLHSRIPVGSLCSKAEDEESCQSDYDVLWGQGHGFLAYWCFGFCYFYIAANNGSYNYTITSTEALANFLGRIDNKEEAAFVAFVHEYQLSETEKDLGAIREDKDGYLMIAERQTSTCPETITRYLLRITYSGELTELRNQNAIVNKDRCYIV